MDGIFGSLPPRHVENANTRLEIRRDESRNQGRKKSGEGDDEFKSIPWEDISYVSVASLLMFLISVITPEPPVTALPPQAPQAVNSASQRAASAYQSVGRAVHDSNVEQAPLESPATHIETNFTEGDLTRIRGFVTDLHEFERRGVTELGLQRNENFLDAVEAAITAAKTA